MFFLLKQQLEVGSRHTHKCRGRKWSSEFLNCLQTEMNLKCLLFCIRPYFSVCSRSPKTWTCSPVLTFYHLIPLNVSMHLPQPFTEKLPSRCRKKKSAKAEKSSARYCALCDERSSHSANQNIVPAVRMFHFHCFWS